MRQSLAHIPARRASRHGFTLIEIVAVLVIVGILAAVIVPRATRPSLAAPRAAEVASHLRFLQLRAMKDKTSAWGMSCDGTSYWGFNGTDPNNAAARIPLPGEAGTVVAVAGKNMGLSVFTVLFDQYGIPYSANPTTKLAANATLTVTDTASGGTATLTITPETGFIP